MFLSAIISYGIWQNYLPCLIQFCQGIKLKKKRKHENKWQGVLRVWENVPVNGNYCFLNAHLQIVA